jgi:hypothetical protein
LRDNPVAIAEGAAGAPKNMTASFGGGIILPSFSATGSTIGVGNPGGYTNIGDYSELLFHGAALTSADNAANIQVRFSNTGGSSWGSLQTVGQTPSVGTLEIIPFSIHINTITGFYSAISNTNNNGTLTVPSNANAIQFVTSSSNTSLRMFGEVKGMRAGTGA